MRDLLPSPSAALVRILRPTAEKHHLCTLPWHAHEIVAAFLLYQTVFHVISPVLSRYLAPETYERLSRKTQVNWNIHVTSQVQSVFVCAIALYVIFADEERRQMDWEGRIWGYTGASGMVQAFAAGYFLWDVLVSATNLDTQGPGSLLHAICALFITCIGFRPFANYYGLNFILYELSTPFLNIHWFLDKLNMTGSNLQLVNGICLMAAFFGCRLVWGSYQSVNVYHDMWTAWTTSISTHDPNSSSSLKAVTPSAPDGMMLPSGRILPLWLMVLYLVGNTALVVLNFYWFGKMIQALQKRFKTAPKDTKKD